MSKRVLVVDDDQSMCELIQESLQTHGYEVAWRLKADEALQLSIQREFDVIVTDINLERTSGIDLCRRLRENRPDIPVIVITAFGNMAAAIAAIRAGAYDFIEKPIEMMALAHAVARATERRHLLEEVKRLERGVRAELGWQQMLGESAAMSGVYDLVARLAEVDTTVLLTGESGTGKEIAARALHEHGPRARGNFVAINCAAVPPDLLESELFGHVKGAFTDAKVLRQGLFEQANDGTILLDEVGEMPLEMQAKLLRVLQERQIRPVGGNATVPINTRLLAATNRDLEAEVEAGRFREDLYYRLNVVQIHLPPLRARGKDVLLLAQAFVSKFAGRSQKIVSAISAEASQKLLAYDWPGNVRQLENVIERAVALTHSNQIELSDLPDRIIHHQGIGPAFDELDLEHMPSLDDVERRHIEIAVRSERGNKTQAAKKLGIDRRTLYRKLERFQQEGRGRPVPAS